jgi:hypothetical protein
LGPEVVVVVGVAEAGPSSFDDPTSLLDVGPTSTGTVEVGAVRGEVAVEPVGAEVLVSPPPVPLVGATLEGVWFDPEPLVVTLSPTPGVPPPSQATNPLVANTKLKRAKRGWPVINAVVTKSS